jgi:hypothetical protein
MNIEKFELLLAPELGAQDGCFNENKPRVENLMTISL